MNRVGWDFAGERESDAADVLLDRVARQAAALCGASIGLVATLDDGGPRCAGRFGAASQSLACGDGFCAHAAMLTEPIVVEDVARDGRFDGAPFVGSDPRVRFYAGAPILDERGLALGSVCVLDPLPRALALPGLFQLQRLARMTGVALAARRTLRSAVGTGRDAEIVRANLARLDASLLSLFDEANGFRAPRATLG